MADSRWRLILSPPLDGATNMALDHALARAAGRGDAPPTLRFYRWQPACLSLGYFQRLERDADQAACAAEGVAIVRRPTGGRAILHDREVTYSLAAPAGTPGLGGRILDSYRTISAALLAGLRALGLAAEWAAQAASGADHSAACFDTPGDFEIVAGGRKLLGSAQTRTGGAVLQHGTLLLSADAARLHRLLRLPPDLSSDALAARMVALDELLPAPSWDDAVAALIAGFEQSWGLAFAPGEPTAAEWALAAELREQRYANPAWTARR
ncbi:MAG TPA: lipoate--protein ligase family protein [Herpetosiphonaceae bacterium]